MDRRLVSARFRILINKGIFSTGGRSFTFEAASDRDRLPGLAELSARAARADGGQFAKPSRMGGLEERFDRRFEERHWLKSHLIDETGTPILYTRGRNYALRACAWIIFPDQRWLRFPVRNDGKTATMIAVDQAGNKVARYKTLAKGLDPERSFGLSDPIEITVHPRRKLADELTLALAISARWLRSYFATPGG